MTEPLLTVQEIAERLQVGPEAVRNWLRSGELTGAQLGRRGGWRIRQSEFERFLRARERSPKLADEQGERNMENVEVRRHT